MKTLSLEAIDLRVLGGILAFLGIASVLLLCKVIGDRTDVTRALLLTGATNRWQAVNFIIGEGHHYNIVLGLQRGAIIKSEELRGSLRLMSGSKVVVEIPFDVAISPCASWLMDHGLDAYVLTWPTNAPPTCLDTFFEVGGVYTLVVDFCGALPSEGSLWLTYLQQCGRRKKPTVLERAEKIGPSCELLFKGR